MLSEQCQKDLNQMMNHLRTVGVSLMQARRVFEKSRDAGISAMLKHEAMERWEIGGMIADYLIAEGGDVLYDATPAPNKALAGPAYLSSLVALDEMTVTVLDTMITAALNRGASKTAMFMQEVRNCAKDEYDEMRDRTAEITRLANDPALILYDAHLYDKYHPSGKDYHYKYDYNPC